MASTKTKTVDVSDDMLKLAKDKSLEEGEKAINMYSKVKVKGTGKGPLDKDKIYEVHPEHIDHLVKKGFASEIKGENVETKVPLLEGKKDEIIIQA